MEEKVSVWKSNLTNGLVLGLVGIVYSLVVYFMDLTFNQVQGYLFLIIEIGLLYFLLKSYRDNFLNGQISYGQSFGAGMVLCLYYSIIMAIFTYLLYTVIDTGLSAKQLAFTEETMLKKGLPQASVDAGMAIQAKLMKPAIMAPITILGNMIGGAILSLIVSIFIKKEGNPLIDAPQN